MYVKIFTPIFQSYLIDTLIVIRVVCIGFRFLGFPSLVVLISTMILINCTRVTLGWLSFFLPQKNKSFIVPLPFLLWCFFTQAYTFLLRANFSSWVSQFKKDCRHYHCTHTHTPVRASRACCGSDNVLWIDYANHIKAMENVYRVCIAWCKHEGGLGRIRDGYANTRRSRVFA